MENIANVMLAVFHLPCFCPSPVNRLVLDRSLRPFGAMTISFIDGNQFIKGTRRKIGHIRSAVQCFMELFHPFLRERRVIMYMAIDMPSSIIITIPFHHRVMEKNDTMRLVHENEVLCDFNKISPNRRIVQQWSIVISDNQVQTTLQLI